jgi:hypothetical protein
VPFRGKLILNTGEAANYEKNNPWFCTKIWGGRVKKEGDGDEEERILCGKRERPMGNKVGEGNDNYKNKATGIEDRGDDMPQYFELIYYFTFLLTSYKIMGVI